MPKLRQLAAAAVAVAVAIGLPAATAGPAVAATPASAGVANLMGSYSASTGLIGGGWWTSAVALSTVEAYRQATGDTTYDYAIAGAFSHNKSGNFENDYLDDTGWWGVAWMQAYDITGNTDYLHMAETDAGYLHSYWDSTCGGGVWWSTAKAYKNAIPNELFLQLTAGLHNRVAGDTTYLGWANAEWSWFSGSGMINSAHLVNDGLTSGCANNGQQTWTYNQGVILSGLSELYKATGSTGLLTTAEAIAGAATTTLSGNGVLREPCEPSCTGDAISFKGPFIRGLKTLAVTAGSTAYNTFLQAQSTSIVAHDTNSAGGIGENWAGPVGSPTSASQAAGDDALVAALNPVPAAVSGPVRSGIAGKCLDVSGANSTNGTAVQLWDCNGTNAQSWSVVSGTLRALGKCLDATANGTANGTKLELWDCNGGGNQTWSSNNGGYRNPASGRCVDDPQSSTSNGSQVQLWDCNGTNAQKWTAPGA